MLQKFTFSKESRGRQHDRLVKIGANKDCCTSTDSSKNTNTNIDQIKQQRKGKQECRGRGVQVKYLIACIYRTIYANILYVYKYIYIIYHDLSSVSIARSCLSHFF